MTCIIGLKHDNIVTLGCDSVCANVSTCSTCIIKQKKVFNINDFIIGVVGHFRVNQLLQYTLHLPTVDNNDIFKYMVLNFIPAVRKSFKDGGFLELQDNIEYGHEFMVGYKDRLFTIESNFQLIEIECEYRSIGSGQEYACGSLYTGSGDPYKRILKALQSAQYHSAYVADPYFAMNTRDLKVFELK